ncbi:MAG TPA: sigma-70 family RNA polymerase sigma factor [Lacipirellulaceae bacterium]|jgi:RNA polymerase sigma factor (TIGR02999 family)|nr:sigma-70 family RNA polymerase sigma factor [Lacipirellulaceae bacterium]
MTSVTQILLQIEQVDGTASEQLLPLVYDELRKLASVKLAAENPGQTLQTTALVHEAYLRLVDVPKGQHWNSTGHFFAAAAEAMRRILVENARKKRSLRRGGRLKRVPLEQISSQSGRNIDQIIALDESLSRLEKLDKTKAELVKLRYFAGLTIPQAAKALGISITTANRYWAYARAWLHEELPSDADRNTRGPAF